MPDEKIINIIKEKIYDLQIKSPVVYVWTGEVLLEVPYKLKLYNNRH